MNNEEKIISMLETMYLEFSKRFTDIDKRFEGIDNRFENIQTRLTSVENSVVRIENDHGQKLDALFDGYKMNSEKLDRIEKEVSKHEEVILRRIR